MKLLFAILFAVVTAQAINIKGSHDNLEYDIDEEWYNFKKTHKRAFHLSSHEKERKAIFVANLEKIKLHNLDYERGLKSYMMGVNQFTDMTSEEFRNTMLSPMKVSKKERTFLPPLNIGELPKEVDWVKEGYVTPVKNQSQCGACWAFSATGAIEGQHFRKTGKLVSLSEQNLIDCSWTYGTSGCHGGEMDSAFFYVKENQGIDTEESYPYVGQVQDCKFDKKSVGATVFTYVGVREDSEENLQKAIATVGPISVGINARLQSFKDYKTGVYDEPACDPEDLCHAVLVVGYGTEDGKDYYLVKNSWGHTWGDNGYIKMARNKNNQCGIARAATYPVV